MANPKQVLVGAAETDITPALGTHLNGDACRLRPVDKVVQPIFARALVAGLADGPPADRVCLVTLDLCTIGNECGDKIRKQIADRFGFQKEAVILHLMQNHSAPSLGGHMLLKPNSPYVSEEFWWVYQADPSYEDFVVPRILDVIEQAVATLQPVTMGCLGKANGQVSFNRRFLKRNGWIQSQPRGDDLFEVLRAEGPIDPEVGVTVFKDMDDKVIAALLHHTGHPVSFFSQNWVTSSWPGAWCRQFKQLVGDQCVPLMINGCCGNINVWPCTHTEPGADDEAIAESLMKTTVDVLDKMSFSEPTAVGFRSTTLDLPFSDMAEQIGIDDVERARQLLKEHPEPRWRDDTKTALDIEWLFALIIIDMHRRISSDQTYPYEVQAFRLGDLGFVGLIGEPFVEGQLDIKQHSPAPRTFVAHMCNGFICYVPTRSGHRAVNYNFMSPEGKPVRRGANLFLLQEDALEQVAGAATAALESLFERQKINPI